MDRSPIQPLLSVCRSQCTNIARKTDFLTVTPVCLTCRHDDRGLLDPLRAELRPAASIPPRPLATAAATTSTAWAVVRAAAGRTRCTCNRGAAARHWRIPAANAWRGSGTRHPHSSAPASTGAQGHVSRQAASRQTFHQRVFVEPLRVSHMALRLAAALPSRAELDNIAISVDRAAQAAGQLMP